MAAESLKSVKSAEAVDLLGLDPFERASEPHATARKDLLSVMCS